MWLAVFSFLSFFFVLFLLFFLLPHLSLPSFPPLPSFSSFFFLTFPFLLSLCVLIRAHHIRKGSIFIYTNKHE